MLGWHHCRNRRLHGAGGGEAWGTQAGQELHQPCTLCVLLGIPVILPWSQMAEPKKYRAGSAGPGSARGDVLWGSRSWFLLPV